MAPEISIIIPVKNGMATIEKCVRSCALLEGPSFELVIIDDGSTDDTARTVNRLAAELSGLSLKLIQTPGEGPSKARNRGIAAAQGAFIAFTDGDCIVDRHWLIELKKCFDDATVSGAGGIQLSPEDESIFGRSVNEFMGQVGFMTDYMKAGSGIGGRIDIDHNPTCNAMYRADVFVKVGGFLENLWPGEDVELDYRVKQAGMRLVATPAAKVYHYRPATFRKFCRMMYSYGRVQAFLVKRYGFFRTIQYVPLVFFPAVLFGVLSGILLAGFSAAFTGFFLFFYVKNRNAMTSFNYAMFAVATMLAWNIGFLNGLIHRDAK